MIQTMITFKIPQAKWPGKLYPALRGGSISSNASSPHFNSYDDIAKTYISPACLYYSRQKTTRNGVQTSTTEQAAVNTLGHFQGILQQFLHGQTFDQICWTLAQEFTYKYVAKHIVSFIRSLQLAEPVDSAIETDQYISSKHLPREKSWLKHQPH